MRMTTSRASRAAAVAAALIGLGVLSCPAAVAQETAPHISRADLIARAKTWLTADNGKPVPYGSGLWGGYRQDCSGYVSMAAVLPKKEGGPNTIGLYDNFTTAINKQDVQTGDLFIDRIGQTTEQAAVVIFEKWVDGSKTRYWPTNNAAGMAPTTGSSTTAPPAARSTRPAS